MNFSDEYYFTKIMEVKNSLDKIFNSYITDIDKNVFQNFLIRHMDYGWSSGNFEKRESI